jgi:hypothetical protein
LAGVDLPVTFIDADVRPLRDAAEARECAELMAPWSHGARSAAPSKRVRGSPIRPRKCTWCGQATRWPASWCSTCTGCWGYIQTVCVAPVTAALRARTFLVGWAERRIARESQRLSASPRSTPTRARYRRLGYEVVGTLTDFIVTGHHETLPEVDRIVGRIPAHLPAS